MTGTAVVFFSWEFTEFREFTEKLLIPNAQDKFNLIPTLPSFSLEEFYTPPPQHFFC